MGIKAVEALHQVL